MKLCLLAICRRNIRFQSHHMVKFEKMRTHVNYVQHPLLPHWQVATSWCISQMYADTLVRPIKKRKLAKRVTDRSTMSHLIGRNSSSKKRDKFYGQENVCMQCRCSPSGWYLAPTVKAVFIGMPTMMIFSISSFPNSSSATRPIRPIWNNRISWAITSEYLYSG